NRVGDSWARVRQVPVAAAEAVEILRDDLDVARRHAKLVADDLGQQCLLPTAVTAQAERAFARRMNPQIDTTVRISHGQLPSFVYDSPHGAASSGWRLG